MSDQWEVVGKKKNKDNLLVANKKSGTSNKKKVIAEPNIPKVEDILPKNEVKSLFSSNKNKENRKPNKVPENETIKKVLKKVEKQPEPSKPKPPKTIESALKLINVNEFKSSYESNKQLFPDAPLIWLKDLVQFLNHQVPVEIPDPTFSTKPDYYPLSVVPGPLRSAIERSVKEAGHSNAQLFFDLALISMANDMSKNLSAIGFKLYIQYLAITDPTFIVTNLSKHAILKNSYQNRPPIGLSILWAVGQAALKDFNVGLKVFQEMMLPVIEMKSYSRYVVQYLISLINRHEKIHINHEQYLLILDVAFANYKNFPNDLRKEVKKIVIKLESMLLSHRVSEKGRTYVDPLLKKMLSNDSDAYRNEVCKVLGNVLINDQVAFSSWSKCYTKYLPQSAILLTYIADNWHILSNKFNKTVIIDLLDAHRVINEELLTKKRKEAGLLEAEAAIKNLKDQLVNQKMVSQRGSYKCKVFVLLLIIGGCFLYQDIKSHGSWQKSVAYRSLKNYGILNYADKALEHSKEGLQWLHIRIEEQVPGYYEKSAEVLQPYVKLCNDLRILGYNHFLHLKEVAVEKYYPAVIATIDTYAPGLYEASQKAVVDTWSTSVVYCTKSINYLKKEVFVGKLAPENVQRVVLEALNTTQQKAAQCYNWIYEKVQSAIK